MVGLAATLLAPLAGHASHGGPDDQDPRDWAEGSAQIVIDPSNFPGLGDELTLDSSTGPNGAGVNGTVTITSTTGAEFRGRVQCFIAHEHTATIGGDVLETGGRNVGAHFALRVTDNRTRDDAAFDVFLFSSHDDTKGDCSAEDLGNVPGLAIAVGNATVHDAE
jgi:hypothetical protein